VVAAVLKPGTYKLADEMGAVFTNAWNIEQLRRFYLESFEALHFIHILYHRGSVKEFLKK